MWIKIAVGAVLGLIVGHFVPPGYALWVVLGVIGGYLVELLVGKKADQE
ncbi:MAG: hypothetical protein GX331_09640 [Firmicutes bacterium]|jgi:Na+/H+-dicarboxylate symporter|nr:hypothetical protein [Bacillota bacterium]